MKRNLKFAAYAGAITLAFLAGSQFMALADDEPAAKVKGFSDGCQVAVIDISRIFKESEEFKTKLTELKHDVDEAGEEIKRAQAKITELTNELKTTPLTSPLRRGMEEEVVNLTAKSTAAMQLQKKIFMEREASIYFHTYRRIEKEVNTFAKEHKIYLVLRHQTQEIVESERDSVLQGVNRAVVFQQQIDITDAILERMKKPAEESKL